MELTEDAVFRVTQSILKKDHNFNCRGDFHFVPTGEKYLAAGMTPSVGSRIICRDCYTSWVMTRGNAGDAWVCET